MPVRGWWDCSSCIPMDTSNTLLQFLFNTPLPPPCGLLRPAEARPWEDKSRNKEFALSSSKKRQRNIFAEEKMHLLSKKYCKWYFEQKRGESGWAETKKAIRVFGAKTMPVKVHPLQSAASVYPHVRTCLQSKPSLVFFVCCKEMWQRPVWPVKNRQMAIKGAQKWF